MKNSLFPVGNLVPLIVSNNFVKHHNSLRVYKEKYVPSIFWYTKHTAWRQLSFSCSPVLPMQCFLEQPESVNPAPENLYPSQVFKWVNYTPDLNWQDSESWLEMTNEMVETYNAKYALQQGSSIEQLQWSLPFIFLKHKFTRKSSNIFFLLHGKLCLITE